jgi:hypothetical protein
MPVLIRPVKEIALEGSTFIGYRHMNNAEVLAHTFQLAGNVSPYLGINVFESVDAYGTIKGIIAHRNSGAIRHHFPLHSVGHPQLLSVQVHHPNSRALQAVHLPGPFPQSITGGSHFDDTQATRVQPGQLLQLSRYSHIANPHSYLMTLEKTVEEPKGTRLCSVSNNCPKSILHAAEGGIGCIHRPQGERPKTPPFSKGRADSADNYVWAHE